MKKRSDSREAHDLVTQSAEGVITGQKSSATPAGGFRLCRGIPCRRGFRPTQPRSPQAFSERHACATLWRSLAHRYPIKPYRSPRRPFAADHPPIAWNPTGRRRLHRRRSRWPGWLRTLRLHDGLTLCCLARRQNWLRVSRGMEGCFPRAIRSIPISAPIGRCGVETGSCGLALRAVKGARKDADCRGPGTAPRPICVKGR